MLKVLVDPGHGGIDPGAVGNGLLEKVLTLQISKRIEAMLSEYENVIVKLTRETDKTLTLDQRTDMANEWGADFLLSIHINATNGKANGYEDFIYPGSGNATTAHQNVIHEEIMKQVDFHDRGKKQENLHMLRESKMPALLTENGFIDNPKDAAKLKQASYIDRIARGHVNGIVKAFGLKKKGGAVVAEHKPAAHVEKLVELRITDGKNPDKATNNAYVWSIVDQLIRVVYTDIAKIEFGYQKQIDALKARIEGLEKKMK